MKSYVSIAVTFLLFSTFCSAQTPIPLDSLHWDFQSESYLIENFKGQEAIYLKSGSISLKDANFKNGTIEYDIFLREVRGFPGIYFRLNDDNGEQFYIRPHQSGKPDANQVVPLINGLTSWQLHFGPKYSFPYEYRFDRWTHVKIVVEDDKAQLYLDHAEKPNLSWKLFHEPKAGGIRLTGGNAEALHIANIVVNEELHEIRDFNPVEREAIEGLIPQWQISEKFEEKDLADVDKLNALLAKSSWPHKISVEEGTAANIARAVKLDGDKPGNTVLASVQINSEKEQTKLLEFGYSDRVVVYLNGKPIYKGTNRFRSRDYRYLGTIGLFDAVYLDLKAGENELVLAVSEDFGGWLVTGKITDLNDIEIY